MRYKTVVTVLISFILGATLVFLYLKVTPSIESREFWLENFVSEQRPVKGIVQSNFLWKESDPNGVGREESRHHSSTKEHHPFYISKPFHFPQPRFSKADSILLRSSWITSLKECLRKVQGKQVSVVTSSVEHTDILLNWLIAAKLVASPPIHSILILTLDKGLEELLLYRGFSSLYVNPEWILDPLANVTRVFSQVHIVRMAVIRLINSYGFDLVNYDCDAITLKNPQVVFDSHKDIDLIGTFGKGPKHLFKKWGVTLNTGVMLLRANSRTEYYWETMSQMKNGITDDQGSINKALDTLHVKWLNLEPSQNIDIINTEVYGVVNIKVPHPFKMSVMLMSFNTVCRQTCTPESKDQYYVWHAVAIKENRTVENKIKQAKVGSAWFLSEEWHTISQNHRGLFGVEWLAHIADKHILEIWRQY